MSKKLNFNGWTYYTCIEYLGEKTISILELYFRIDISGRVESLDEETFVELMYEKYHSLDKENLDKFILQTYNTKLKMKLKPAQYRE